MKCDACKLKSKCDELEKAGILPKIEGCHAFTPLPTNADRIRAMSDEELAGFLCSNEWGRIPKSEKGWLDWLRQEAAEPPKREDCEV